MKEEEKEKEWMERKHESYLSGIKRDNRVFHE